ncbi:MAG: hypothetical protein ACRDVC_09155 [Acidimicrobiales bacterium]
MSPVSSGGQLHRVGRGDIAPLHARAGGRACTWFDRETNVCWFLGFTPEHDYELFETRARTGDLLPSEEDEHQWELAREEMDFRTRVREGLRELVAEGIEHPLVPQRGTVGDILRIEITAVVVEIDALALADVYLCVALPIDHSMALHGWPGKELLERLASLVSESSEVEVPTVIPTLSGQRPVNRGNEVAVVVRNVEPLTS